MGEFAVRRCFQRDSGVRLCGAAAMKALFAFAQRGDSDPDDKLR
jgi:hypothetical protein